MRCPKCGAHSEVSQTRASEHLTTTRTRKCFNGHSFKTVEIHEAVWGKAKERASVFSQTAARRIALFKRDREIAKRLHEGAGKLAEEFGLGESGVFVAARRGRKSLGIVSASPRHGGTI